MPRIVVEFSPDGHFPLAAAGTLFDIDAEEIQQKLTRSRLGRSGE